MRLRFIPFLACLAVLLMAPIASPRAARNIETGAVPDTGLQLVVVEVPGCLYCPIFREDVLPVYEASRLAKDVPIRFVDLNDADAMRLTFASPVDVAPTVLLMKNNVEVGRIPGYTGPETFFHLVEAMISQAE